MKITILFCDSCHGYMDKALDVFNEIRREYKKSKIDIIKGYKGQFDVRLKEEGFEDFPILIYSTKLKGRLPRDGEIVRYLKKHRES